MKMRFSRNMQQKGLLDLEANKDMHLRIGFRVYPGAKGTSSASGSTEIMDVEIPELRETKRTILTRKVKKKCEPESQHPDCLQCFAQ